MSPNAPRHTEGRGNRSNALSSQALKRRASRRTDVPEPSPWPTIQPKPTTPARRPSLHTPPKKRRKTSDSYGSVDFSCDLEEPTPAIKTPNTLQDSNYGGESSVASNETHHPRSYARDNGNINSTHAEATYSRSITTTTRSHHSQTAEYEGDTGNIYPPNLRSFDKFRQLSVVPATSLASEETFEPLFSESETAEMQTDRNLNGRNVKERNRRTPGLGNMEAVNRDGSHTGPGYPTDRRHSRSLYTDKRTSAEMVECTPEADEELYEADGSVRYDSEERADERADERMGSDTRAHSATEFPPCRQPVATPEDFTDSGTSPSHAPSGSYPEAPADVPCLFRYADHHGRVECIHATFDPYLSEQTKPGKLPETATFQTALQLDSHGRWNVIIKTLGPTARGVAWIDQADYPVIRQLLITNHTVYVRIEWLQRSVVRDRGVLYKGSVAYSGFCPTVPAVPLTAVRLRTSMDFAYEDGSGGMGINKPSIQVEVPAASSEPDGMESSHIEDVWREIDEENRAEEEERRKEEERRRDTISGYRQSSEL